MAAMYDYDGNYIGDDGATGDNNYVPVVDESGYYDPGFLDWLNTGDFNTPYTGTETDWSTLGNLGGINWAGLASSAGGLLSSPSGSQLLATGGNLLGGYLNTQAAQQAAQTQAAGQIEAARIAADAAKFRPVGVTTNFGQSQFGFDPQGRLSSAGYTLTPQMKAQQDQLMGISQGALDQYGQAQGATAPMAAGAQSMFGLGQQYLGTSPQAQAQKYMADQQALLAPSRASDMAALQAQMQAQGRGGFAIGGDAGMGASNPQLQALLNAQRQQDLGLAAQATQGGMDYAKFGAGMLGSGGQMLRDMYGTQSAAYSPYQQALGGATTIEGLGQNALTQGMALGSTATAANAMSGQLLGQGMAGAANTVGQQAQQAGSTWGNLLQGAGGALNQYQTNQQNQELMNRIWGT